MLINDEIDPSEALTRLFFSYSFSLLTTANPGALFSIIKYHLYLLLLLNIIDFNTYDLIASLIMRHNDTNSIWNFGPLLIR